MSAVPDHTDEPFRFWRSLARYTHGHRRLMVVAAICSALTGAAVALQPVMIKFIVDEGLLRPGNGGDLAPLSERLQWGLIFIAGYVAVSVWRLGCGVTGNRCTIRAVERVLCAIRARFFRHVQNLCMRFHDEVSSGELFNYVMGSPLQSLKQFLHQGMVSIPVQGVSWIVLSAALVSMNARMAVLSILVVTLMVLVNRRSRHYVRDSSHDFLRTESDVSRYVADMLRGSRAIKMYAIEDQVIERFDNEIHRIRDWGTELAIRQMHQNVKSEAVQYAGMACIYLMGLFLVLFENMPIGTYFAFVASITMLMQSMQTLMNLNLIRANAEAGLERIHRILQREATTPEVRGSRRISIARVQGQSPQAEPSIIYDRVAFAYADRTVLDNVSVHIPAGQSVALVGPSGSGKTTFVKLLQRLYDPQQGSIRLAGVDLRAFSQRELRARFGVVPQDPYIFQASIRDNIRVLRPQATDDQIRAVMRRAYVDEFVDQLPAGLDSWVGEGGANLSGGQKQRIAIARVMLADLDIAIFDEATSALDAESEALIQRAMQDLMRGRTSFIVAHRLSTIRDVDRVLVFAHGRIVQDGSFEQLAGQEGLFQDLLRRSGMAPAA